MQLSFPQKPSSAFSFSLGAHLAFFLLLVVVSRTAILAPKGVFRIGSASIAEVTLVSSERAAPAPALVKAESEMALPKAFATAEQAHPEASQLGFEKGRSEAGPLGHPEGVDADAFERYRYELRVLIDRRKVYPPTSKRLRESGKVTVRFYIQEDGRISDVALLSPSSYPRLNEAAVQVISSIEKYRPPPTSTGTGGRFVEIPINYQ